MTRKLSSLQALLFCPHQGRIARKENRGHRGPASSFEEQGKFGNDEQRLSDAPQPPEHDGGSLSNLQGACQIPVE